MTNSDIVTDNRWSCVMSAGNETMARDAKQTA